MEQKGTIEKQGKRKGRTEGKEGKEGKEGRTNQQKEIKGMQILCQSNVIEFRINSTSHLVSKYVKREKETTKEK